MSTESRIFKNSTALLGGHLAERILKLIVMAVLARFLGKSEFGLYIFVLTYVEFFHLLTDLGIQPILVREMARNPDRAEELMGNALTLKLISAGASVLLAVSVILLSGYALSIAELVAWASLSMFLSFRLSSVRQVLDSIFQVRLEMRAPVVLGVGSELLSAIGLLMVVWANLELVWLLAVQNLAYLPGVIGLKLVTRAQVPLKLRWSREVALGLLKESYPLGLASLFTLAYVKVDILMLAVMRGDDAVGIYSAAYRLVGSLTILPMAIIGSTFPLIAQYARTAPEALPRIFQRSLNIIMMLAFPIAIGGMVLARGIIVTVYGMRFVESTLVFSVLSWAVSVSFISYFLTSALNAMDRQRSYLALTAGMTLLNLGLNFFWIPRYGFVGASVATLITECVLMLLCLRLLGPCLKDLMLAPFIKFALAAGVMGLVLKIFSNGIFLDLPLAVIVYATCLALLRPISREEWDGYLSAIGIRKGNVATADSTRIPKD